MKSTPEQRKAIAEDEYSHFTDGDRKENAMYHFRLGYSKKESEIIEAQSVNAELLAALENMVKESDDYDLHSDYAGCIECTAGATPDNLNTGLCPYHQAKAAIAKANTI